MADVRWYRDAQPIDVPWPDGCSVQLRPLTLAEMQSAEVVAVEAAPGARWMRRAAERVSRSMTPHMSADALMAVLTPGQLAGLAICQWSVQQRATVDAHKLGEWVKKSVNDHPDVMEEAAAAWHSESVTAFYGRSVRELTSAQLCWFLCLQHSFEEFHVGTTDSSGKRRPPKQPSGPWLRKDRKERLQWQIDC